MSAAMLGNTTYEMSDATTPGVVRIVRRNSDGEKEFFVPRALIASYVAEKASSSLDGFIHNLIGDNS